MSHSTRHRGPNPKDDELFGVDQIPRIRAALKDFCLLLTKGYSLNASLKLVGDRFELTTRQRLLLMRNAATDVQIKNRQASELNAGSIAGNDIYIDGFNLLITIESAMSGGFIFVGVDGCYRDMSSIHGTYKRVNETHDGIVLIGKTIRNLSAGRAHWLLDQPVSNSGRLKDLLAEIAQLHQWDWSVELCKSPDAELKRLNEITVTSDSVILDAVDQWLNLAGLVIESSIKEANVVGLQ